MKKYLIPCLLALAALGMTSTGCYKDKGNYDYHPLNRLSVVIPKDSTINVMQFDTLRINPEVTQAVPDTSVLKYEWYAYFTAQPRVHRTVIGTTKDLSAQIGFAPQSTPYDLIFRVTDTTTGVSAYHHFKIKISTQLSSGWLVLEHGSENADVDIITPGGSVFYHIFSLANPDKPLPLSTDIVASLYTSWGRFNYVFYADGGYLVNRNTFQVISDYSNLFYHAPDVLNPQLITFPHGSFSSLLVNDSSVYGQSFIYGATHFGGRYAGDYKAMPFILNGLYYDAFFFDNAHKRFIYVGMYGTSVSTFPPKTASQAFDLNHIPKEQLTMLPSYQGNIVSLFKNEHDDSAFLYTVNLRNSNIAIGYQAVLNSPGIAGASLFAASTTVPLLYYAVDNKIYVYDMPANKSRIVYRFPDNEAITVLKMKGDQLITATYDGSQGRVYYLALSPTGDVRDNTYSKKFEGFDKIVDMAYKNG